MNSKSLDEIKEIDELPSLDYSEVPDKVKKAVSLEPESLTKFAKLTWDGKQYSVRIPTEIATDMKISKDDKIRFTMIKPLPENDDEIKLEIKLVRPDE
jgi:hypothetical protein